MGAGLGDSSSVTVCSARFVQRQDLARALDHAHRQRRQARDFDAIAAIGAPGSTLRRKRIWSPDSFTETCRLRTPSSWLGELGQLVIVRGEQRLGANVLMDMLDHGPSQREPIIGGSAAADFVQHDEAARRGGVQDHRRFGHLHHERGPAARQIIGRADAREHAIDDRQQRAIRRARTNPSAPGSQAAPPAASRSICRPCWVR